MLETTNLRSARFKYDACYMSPRPRSFRTISRPCEVQDLTKDPFRQVIAMVEKYAHSTDISQFVRAHVHFSHQVDLSAQVSKLFRLVSTVAIANRNLEKMKSERLTV